ncbi:MAG: 5-methylcytosine-specific restriction endonuclease McrA [Myxococcota bacterium]|jgi:5-methylcytosine-specific restriction endonuclease McrA
MDTLLISATYQPLGCVSWQRAMQLWYSGRAEVVALFTDRVIHGARHDYHLPAVLQFNRARPVRRRRVRFSRRNVYARDRGKCQYCRKTLAWREATYDHVVPRSHGGPTAWDNIVIACRPCNQAKANRTPEQWGRRLLKAPARPRSLPAFAEYTLVWSEEMPAQWQAYLPVARAGGSAEG